jgi:hypothetical protein
MRRLALVLAALAAVLVPAVGASGASHVLLPGCGGTDQAQFEPSNVIIACGDGAFRVTKLKWHTWTGSKATGSGTGKVDNCKPNCAQGKFESFPVKLTASSPKTCSNGKREFTKLHYLFPGKRPKGTVRSDTLARPCSR